MIWAIVYGGLAVVSIGVLAVPTVQVVREVRTLSREVAVAGRQIESALAELDRTQEEKPHDDPA